MKTTLVIMAAGIGSRFGKGTKQLTPVGPSGELIMDYSIYDALQAGFDKIVFIIRKDLLKEFKETIGERIEKIADVEYVFQETDDLPEEYSILKTRTKPWGTGQAVLCCRGVVDTPFAVINADDYYGKESYRLIHDYISLNIDNGDEVQKICMAGFKLGNSLSENGGVTRGLCIVDKDSRLIGIEETKNIEKHGDNGIVRGEAEDRIIDGKTPVSMNMWGFSADFISLLDKGFKEFLSDIREGDVTSEFLLPIYIDELLKAKKAAVDVLKTDSKWFGVTYQEDKEAVSKAFEELARQGVYSYKLYE